VPEADWQAEDALTAHKRVSEAQGALDLAVAERASALAELRAAGWSLQAIADLLGVSKARIAQIVAR
jgi:DNA-directed RNA polymerase specialized sigma24 family protein